MAEIKPLTEITGTGKLGRYVVLCRECGEVTEMETNAVMLAGTASLVTAGLLRNRHLARHLQALTEEIVEASR